ncbi:MAG TPA: hypothetical protein P5218_09160 [Planctomycetota bacterium]|nr:hypothetical protein [Planctomycetota bacterium]
MRPCLLRTLIGLLLILWGGSSGLGWTQASGTAGRVRHIDIVTRNVFSREKVKGRWLYRFINALHVPTHEPVVRRRIWFAEGDMVTYEELAELERNLRAIGLFAEVSVEAQPTGQPGEIDVAVLTRDLFSLQLGASGFSVGGVSGFHGSLAESNLFGRGDKVGVSAKRNSNGELETLVSYTDLYLFGSPYRMRVAAGTTEEGPQVQFEFGRPFYHLEDPNSWGVAAAYIENLYDYYDGGETTAEVPTDVASARAFIAFAEGTRERRRTLGYELRLEHTNFGVARGPAAPGIDVPGNLDQATLASRIGYEWNQSFLKLERLDALDAVEDVALGLRVDLLVGGLLRAEENASTRLEPVVEPNLRAAWMPAEDTYLSLQTTGRVRWFEEQATGWNSTAALHLYQQSLPYQTLALSLVYDQAYEGEDLPIQYNLGEDNGLRGYPAREFAGTRRLRLNLEDRIFTDVRYRSIRLGIVPFFDMGWIGEDGFGSPKRGVGIGLRFGSTELFGDRVLRMDFAFPLDQIEGQDFRPSFSISIDQVFSFFGNSSRLSGN